MNTITIKPTNVITRWPCAVCGGWTEKHDVVAVIEPDPPGRFVCQWCIEASSAEAHEAWRTNAGLVGDEFEDESYEFGGDEWARPTRRTRPRPAQLRGGAGARQGDRHPAPRRRRP